MQNVVLSIDGRKSVNDFMRPTAGGQGTYDRIVPKFQKLAESRNQKNYYVRGTYTHENLDFSEDVLHLADLGFKQISVEPVVADTSESYALQPEDLPTLSGQYEKLAVEMKKRRDAGQGFNFFHYMIDLNGGPCVYKRINGCGAGVEYMAVAPSGDLYPCHQFVGMPEFLLGNIYEGVVRPEICERFAAVNAYTKPECRKCWAKFYCGGGCAAAAFNQNGDITKPYQFACDLERKRVECAIYLSADES
jgi:uncharacterized protein